MDGNSGKKRPRKPLAALITLAGFLVCICPPAGPARTAIGQETKPAPTQPDPNWQAFRLSAIDIDLLTYALKRANSAGLLPTLVQGMLPGQSWKLPLSAMPLAICEVYEFWPGVTIPITISPATTCVASSMTYWGRVIPDYVKYLNDKYSKGVTAGNNAAGLILRAIGPGLLAQDIRDETLDKLGLSADILDSDKHFVIWKDRTRKGKAGLAASRPSSLAGTQESSDANIPSLVDVLSKCIDGEIHPDLEQWLADNAQPLELFRQASAKEKLYIPLVSTKFPPSLMHTWVPYWRPLQQAGQAMAMRAILKMRRNDCAGAWDDVMTVHRLARLAGQGPNLVDQIVATGLDGTAAMAGTTLATRGSMSAKQYKEILARLQALGPASDVLGNIDEMERFYQLDRVCLLYLEEDFYEVLDHPSARKFSLRNNDVEWDQLFRVVNYWMDLQIEAERLPLFHGREEAQKAYDDKQRRLKLAATTRPNTALLWLPTREPRFRRWVLTRIFSNMIGCGFVPSPPKYTHMMEDDAIMKHEIEKLAVALACFHAKKGRWPAELKELCPDLLKTIPPDIFADKPLAYKPGKDGYLLYSVGRNDFRGGDKCDPRSPDASPANRKRAIVAQVKASAPKP